MFIPGNTTWVSDGSLATMRNQINAYASLKRGNPPSGGSAKKGLTRTLCKFSPGLKRP